MSNKPEDRVEKIVAALLHGRRLKLRGGDAEEKEAITAAARLAGARYGPERMRPEFRRALAAQLDATPRDGFLTRRAALVAGLSLAAGAAGGAVLGRATLPGGSVHAAPEAVEPANGRWVDVAALSDLVEGQGRLVNAGGVGAFVFRSGDSVSAVSSICSHLPCELWWDEGGANLACPCHPARFLADGAPVGSYGLPSLNPVHARVTAAGRVEVFGTE